VLIDFELPGFTWHRFSGVTSYPEDTFYAKLVSRSFLISTSYHGEHFWGNDGYLGAPYDYYFGQIIPSDISGTEVHFSKTANTLDDAMVSNWSVGDTIQGSEQGFAPGPSQSTFLSNLTLTDISNTNPIPEPSTLALLGIGILGFYALKRKSRTAQA
jgi:hypothetical protein